MFTPLKGIACMFIRPATFKASACVLCGGSVVGAGAYGAHKVGGGHPTYQEGKKYCLGEESNKNCVFIGPAGNFQGQGIYFEEGIHGTTVSFIDDQWMKQGHTTDPGKAFEKLLEHYPGLREYLSKWREDHKGCDFQGNSVNLERKMVCPSTPE
ncbi:hypothetical protein MHLP_00410 [Candidatus Mycoplasma haematolamae str. Purdue]|uniref:Uncharacterized protein n=1 Tax=Mycoplasma haematolamae (strain Purdue) TaxID=1212765 RepID=I7C580_MYCHA|nr:hypothetical protein [Candidatus Mycoplasma haematolamae]AFO51662.1 hypothetical protein MHLP_00410 [Candidatus Mycoplasma haematolamae str. Purdue]